MLSGSMLSSRACYTATSPSWGTSEAHLPDGHGARCLAVPGPRCSALGVAVPVFMAVGALEAAAVAHKHASWLWIESARTRVFFFQHHSDEKLHDRP